MKSRKLDLYKPTVDLLDAHAFGFIVHLPTGILWTTQVGGTYCGHPQIEGLFIPAPFDNYTPASSRRDDGVRDFYETDYEGYQKVATVAIDMLRKDTNGVIDYLAVLSKEEFDDLPKEAQVGAEAWVPCRLLGKREQKNPPLELETFEGETVIVTWRNSD